MLNRLISNFVLGFFVVVLVVVYGVAKQIPSYQFSQTSATALKDGATDNPQPDSMAIQSMPLADGAEIAEVAIPGGAIVEAQIASTPAQREQGLSGTDALADGHGMLFSFPKPGLYGMWMKGMNYNLDMVWLNEHGQVVKIVENAPAPAVGVTNWPAYENTVPASFVLELPAGATEKYGLSIGAQLGIS